MLLDIEKNRVVRSWTPREQAGRVLWGMAYPLFRLSPRICRGWRRGILRLFGASVDAGAHIYPSARITIPWKLFVGRNASIGERVVIYNLGDITIGPGATISQGAHLCAGTHDYRRSDMPLIKTPITIGEGAWVCTEAFIGPGVNVGCYAIVGARAVVMRDVEDWTIVAGNPAVKIKRREPPTAP